MLQNRSHQHLPINQRIHPHPIKSLIPHHKLIPCPLIKPYCCLIPGKHMQPHLPAPCRTRLHLHPLHQPGSQPTPPKLRCNIQRHHIPHASPLRRPDMHNTKPRQYPIQLRNHNLRTPRLRKGPHIPPRKPERLLKAHHIQRIHCIQIPRPISTKQKVTHLSIISVSTSPNPNAVILSIAKNLRILPFFARPTHTVCHLDRSAVERSPHCLSFIAAQSGCPRHQLRVPYPLALFAKGWGIELRSTALLYSP